MKRLPIFKHPKLWALVDDEDYASARRFIWHLMVVKRKNKWKELTSQHYIVFTLVKEGERYKNLYLSRLVAKPLPTQKVRQRNNNYLDCRKQNLSVGGKQLAEPDFYEALASVKMSLLSGEAARKKKIWLNTPIPDFANQVYDRLIFLEDQEIARKEAEKAAIEEILARE